MRKRGTADGEYMNVNVRINPHGNINPTETKIQLVKVNKTTGAEAELVPETVIAENTVTKLGNAFAVTYFNAIQSMVTISVINETEADKVFGDEFEVKVNFKYKKRGEAGIPTYMDWEGCVGSVKVLLEL